MLPAGILRPGDVLCGRYRLIRRVATGGMGEVWQATDLVLTRDVAVKVLRPTLLGNPSFETRFRDEARLLATVQHPGVVNVFDYGKSVVAGGIPVAFLVMAYVDGVPLSRWIAAAGRLSVAQTVSVAAQAADALHAAHLKGIVHSDVKPANLLVERDGTVVLVDFGVAQSAALSTLDGDTVLATPQYMAPEQATRAPLSAATDVYALGAVMYHCLAGRPPFTGDDPLKVAAQQVLDQPPPLPAGIPDPVRVLVRQALAKQPALRPPSGAVFAKAARAAAAGPGTRRHTAPALIATQTSRDKAEPIAVRRRRYAVAAGLAVLAALAAGATVTGLDDTPLRDAPASTPSSTPSSAPTRSPSAEPSGVGGGGQASLDPGSRLRSPRPTSNEEWTPSAKTTAPRPHAKASPTGQPTTPSTTPSTTPTTTTPSTRATSQPTASTPPSASPPTTPTATTSSTASPSAQPTD